MIRRIALCACALTLFLLPAVARDFYWEDPQILGSVDSRFPQSASNGSVSAVLYQEIERSTSDSGRVWLSMRVYSSAGWQVRARFAGPFAYEGDVPSIASVSIDSRGTIFVAAATAVNAVSVFGSNDLGSTFIEQRIRGDTSAVLSPRVFALADGSYLLFATRGGEDNFSLVSAKSSDGRAWSSFETFAPSAGMRRPFLPAHATLGSTDVIVFQSFYEGSSRSSYQLYSTVSSNGGKSWSSPYLLTSFADSATTYENWHNQRPRLQKVGGSLCLAWERARTASEKYAIYFMNLDSLGRPIGQSERISSTDGYCYDPDIADSDGIPTVVWFDNRRGVNRVYMARKEGYLWDETDISRSSRDSVFGRVVTVGGDIEVYWQQAEARGVQRVVRLAPDRTAKPAVVQPVNFASGAKGRGDVVRALVNLPDDSSGIAGYSWAWGRGEQPWVPSAIQKLPEDNRLSVEADADGPWYLGVRVADYAGNWSAPRYVEYIRDTTPPDPPSIQNPDLDDKGFVSSNTFTVSWDKAPGEIPSGYSWSLEYLAPLSFLPTLGGGSKIPASFDLAAAAAARFGALKVPVSLRTRESRASFVNRDNGVYAFTVSAIDEVGNVGQSTVRYLVLNKYVPVTFITYVDSSVDETGVAKLSIVGRGFSEGGLVTDVYLDRDGKAPWDIRLARADGRFKVDNDRLITGISLSDVEEGSYRVVLAHPVRGLYVTKPILSFTAFGTVKFGDYRYQFEPPWAVSADSGFRSIRPDTVLLMSILAFALALLSFSAWGIAGTAREAARIRGDVRALITGDIMPSEQKKKAVALRKRGIGLRLKLASFTTALVISVVLIVSIPLGLQFSANQERTLAQGLQSRVEVLLESLASGARAYLPSQNILELGFLPDQMAALSEARSATITGNGSGGAATGIDYVWATNNASIGEEIDTQALELGKSRVVGEVSDEIGRRVTVLDEEAAQSVGELSDGITSLTQEGIKLALSTDEASVTRRDEIQTITRQLEEKLNAELTRLSVSGMGSWPEYNPQSLSREVTQYVFYKPVMYRQGSDVKYVHGTVRVTISTESLLETVNKDRIELVRTTVFVALFAVLIGVIGASILASIIISPVRKLAAHVAMIRDTEDKEELEGKDIKLRSRDEIGLLGETVNDMTHGLVKAAAASKDLTVGKEVQKMFIPLETDKNGHKLTCGKSTEKGVEFFGYYEGAKGVSGDYFDYVKLDDRHYAIIKCDVAGKGVPAALIMVEVATLFLDYFKDWKYAKNGYRLTGVVTRINDLIESRGFKGRFAAFTLCIFDARSGDVHFCNAGDNLIHIFDSATRKMKVITLPETPAAGIFPSFMVDMKGGFAEHTVHLNAGDVLFLYTDGIEEAKRLFRTEKLVVHACAEEGLEKDAPHGSHSVGQDNEELGPERVNEIIEAVFSRSVYTLYKWHNPQSDEPFEFDFTSCEGTVEEAILALVSVEKIFRMYRDPSASDFDRVQVDRKVDSFLNGHFRQYLAYCANHRDHPEFAEYQYYTKIREDAQYDDLTILGLKKGSFE